MSDTPTMTFWDHLDELRSVIIRVLVVTGLAAVVAFCLKDELFAIVLAPRSSDFITYRLMGVEPFSVHLMNTGLTEQFMIHMKTAMYAGVLVASPYIIYMLFRFVSPALYDNERRYATLLCGSDATTCHCGDTGCCCHHYPNHRCFHASCGCPAYMVAL